MAKKVLTQLFSEPLNTAGEARFDIHAGDGNLTIDGRADAQALVNGALEYLENQEQPDRSLEMDGGQAILRLRGGRIPQPWLHLPWAACNGATVWQVHLNPAVPADVSAHSNGGNLRLDLSGMQVTQVAAETGGGNVELVLPGADSLCADARTGGGSVSIEVSGGLTGVSTINAGSGAGSVSVRLPHGVPARIYATTGLGKTIIDPQYIQVEKFTYQSAGFDQAADRIEVIVKSGAGNVSVSAA